METIFPGTLLAMGDECFLSGAQIRNICLADIFSCEILNDLV